MARSQTAGSGVAKDSGGGGGRRVAGEVGGGGGSPDKTGTDRRSCADRLYIDRPSSPASDIDEHLLRAGG